MANEYPKELREFIESEIQKGHFLDQGQVVAEALLQMKERRERAAWLQARLDEGLDDVKNGRVVEWNLEATLQRLLDRAANKAG